MIDLRSDTVTKPGRDMLYAMMQAVVGDDVFEDDPTTIELEEYAARLFGMEAALFCPSGTMSNQIAIKVHTNPGDEVICDKTSHIYNYEGGGIAVNSGASVRLLDGDRGRFTAADVIDNINPDNIHYPLSSLVVAENTCNKGGGSYYAYSSLNEIARACKTNGLKFHLDGARIFNALAETGEQPVIYGKLFDSISICLSKGLGAPVGSVLIGSTEFIKKARRVRKVLGGGMRQSGYLAAAGLYALKNNIDRLSEDHVRAKVLESELQKLDYVQTVIPVDTNIIVFRLNKDFSENDFHNFLEINQVKAVGFGPSTIRMVTHLNFSDEMLAQTIEILKAF